MRPTEQRALDALATQYEHMKRWPDLIGVLQKKAPTLSDTHEQVELYLRIAGLFQEKFSNVAEAIKAYEKVLELDGGNATAIAYLKMNYEKRRDWEKLIGVHQKEIERIENPTERGAKFIEVAKLASEKLKKPSVSIELWQKVLDSNPTHLEALSASWRSSTSARRSGTSSPTSWRRRRGSSTIASRRSRRCRSSASSSPTR